MVSKGRRLGWRLTAVVVAVLLAAPVAGVAAAQKNGKKQEPKRSKEENQQIQAVYQAVDKVMAGDPAPASFQIGWRNDFLKAQNGLIYVPFTLSIDPAALPQKDVVLYLRVAERPSADEAAESGKDKDRKERVYPYEDVWFPTLASPAAGLPLEVSRAFAVKAGDYDVYIGVRERTKDKKAKPVEAVLKQPLSVPDYWNGELATSSVIVAGSVKQLAAPLSEKEQAEQPYTIGRMQITPTFDNTFKKTEELSIIFLVYNPALKDNKPDVAVEYKFHQKTADGEKYFNRTAPTLLNASTLPPNFDLGAGHQLVAGQSVPLASFPPGDYRLEIDVQDKLSQKTITHNVLFTVTGS
jgi:hypothetical protein